MTLDDLISQINTATNAVAARLDSLKAQLSAAIAAGQAPTQAQLDELAAISSHLTAMGADPANPVPSPAAAPTV